MSEIQAGEIGTGGTLMSVSDVAVDFRARRKTARALDGVSLDWRPGEILGIVGESGCGKSTLARAMLGLQPASEGELLRGPPRRWPRAPDRRPPASCSRERSDRRQSAPA